MKAIPVLLTVFVLLLFATPAVAGECIREPIAITDGGNATTGFVPGEAYISVVFDEPLEELFFTVININYPYEMIYQGADGFAAVVQSEETNPKYNYIAVGYRCRLEYRVLMPLVIR